MQPLVISDEEWESGGLRIDGGHHDKLSGSAGVLDWASPATHQFQRQIPFQNRLMFKIFDTFDDISFIEMVCLWHGYLPGNSTRGNDFPAPRWKRTSMDFLSPCRICTNNITRVRINIYLDESIKFLNSKIISEWRSLPEFILGLKK